MSQKRKKPTDEWQLGEIRAGLADLDAQRAVAHGRVAKMAEVLGAA
jgi:predicted transcriptional regulator